MAGTAAPPSDRTTGKCLEIRTPPVVDGYREAYEQSIDRLEPIFVPVPVFADDRGWSLMNMLLGVLEAKGQINFSVQYPDVVLFHVAARVAAGHHTRHATTAAAEPVPILCRQRITDPPVCSASKPAPRASV